MASMEVGQAERHDGRDKIGAWLQGSLPLRPSCFGVASPCSHALASWFAFGLVESLYSPRPIRCCPMSIHAPTPPLHERRQTRTTPELAIGAGGESLASLALGRNELTKQ